MASGPAWRRSRTRRAPHSTRTSPRPKDRAAVTSANSGGSTACISASTPTTPESAVAAIGRARPPPPRSNGNGPPTPAPPTPPLRPRPNAPRTPPPPPPPPTPPARPNPPPSPRDAAPPTPPPPPLRRRAEIVDRARRRVEAQRGEHRVRREIANPHELDLAHAKEPPLPQCKRRADPDQRSHDQRGAAPHRPTLARHARCSKIPRSSGPTRVTSPAPSVKTTSPGRTASARTALSPARSRTALVAAPPRAAPRAPRSAVTPGTGCSRAP